MVTGWRRAFCTSIPKERETPVFTEKHKQHCNNNTAFPFSKPVSASPKCGICLHGVKNGQGTSIFTAECCHVFHFPYVATHVKKQQLLICPVCSATWKELPFLSIHHKQSEIKKEDHETLKDFSKIKNLRVYNDDEPLMSPSPGSLFNPIPELEENDVEEEEEFQGFFVNPAPVKVSNHVNVNGKNVEVTLLPESPIVTVGRSYQTHVVVLKNR